MNNGMIQGIAILSLTLLVVVLIPFIGPVAVIMTPLPILYFWFRLGRMQGLASLAIAFLIVSGILIFLGRPASISVLMMISLTGVIIAEVLQRRYSIEKTFALASLVLFFSGIGFVLYYALQTGVAPLRLLEMYITGIIKENLKLYAQMDISEDQITMIRENIPEITQFFTNIFPGLALSGAMLTVWLNVLSGRLLLLRHAVGFPDFGDLTLWKAPEKLVWLLITSGLMVLVTVDILETVGMNILIICSLVYLFQGLAIAGFFFRYKKVPVMFRWFFYMLIVVQQYMVILLIAFGIFDLWVDFRKRIAGIKDVHA
ncbi:MAG: hypothetical protein C0390_09230 [Syntrophus sp. (in: bacteria)]|nr:hypothetical protein [Syntrophus sp. (in: bacteria)]